MNNLDIIIIDSHKPGPYLLFLAGIHGNEPAGTYGLEKIIDVLKNHLQ
jgi:predicted deacylase